MQLTWRCRYLCSLISFKFVSYWPDLDFISFLLYFTLLVLPSVVLSSSLCCVYPYSKCFPLIFKTVLLIWSPSIALYSYISFIFWNASFEQWKESQYCFQTLLNNVNEFHLHLTWNWFMTKTNKLLLFFITKFSEHLLKSL